MLYIHIDYCYELVVCCLRTRRCFGFENSLSVGGNLSYHFMILGSNAPSGNLRFGVCKCFAECWKSLWPSSRIRKHLALLRKNLKTPADTVKGFFLRTFPDFAFRLSFPKNLVSTKFSRFFLFYRFLSKISRYF